MAPLPLFKPPADTLGRFQWGLLGFAALNFVAFAGIAAFSPAGAPERLAAIAALLAGAGLCADGFRRRGPTVFHDGLVALLLGIAAQGFSKPTLVLSLVFAWLTWAQLYGGVFRSILRVLLAEAMWFAVMYLAVGVQFSGAAGQLIGVTMASIFSFALGTALARVQKSEARFRALVQNASDLIAVIGADGRLKYLSPAAQRAFPQKVGDPAGALADVKGPEAKLTLAGVLRDCEVIVTDLRDDPDVAGRVVNVRDIGDRQALNDARHEVAIAARIQTALLPRGRSYAGFDVAAVMLPASTVGGDYYDILETDDGLVIGIGDVSGHGLSAGLVMLMTQSVVQTLVRSAPRATPREMVLHLNRVLYENVRGRLGQREHVTFSLLKLHRDGRVSHAGAHEELYVLRSATRVVEAIPTRGVWLGAVPDVSETTVQAELRLLPGDVLLLHTDGITEARDAAQQEYGPDRLTTHLAASTADGAAALVQELVDAVEGFSRERTDDRSLVVVRYLGQGNVTEINSGAKLASA